MNEPAPSGHPGHYRPLPPGFTRVLEVWGDARKRRDITVEGETVSVTASLHGVLTAFRHRPLPSCDGPHPGGRPAQRRVRRLWADGVCINQADLAERTSQVELMGRIFAGARRVLAWLGWDEGEAGRRHKRAAIRFIHSFMEDPEAGLRDARVLLHHQASPAQHLITHLPEDDRRRLEQQARNWEAIKVFFEIEYFHRTWIVQELGLAREAIMYTALKPADGAEAGSDAGGDSAAESKSRQVLELDFIDWQLVARFVKFLDFSGGASLVNHLGVLSWVATHIWMVWAVKEDGTPRYDFLTGMHWVRILGVTDARDRVYSLLGHPLAAIDGDLVIKPDYTSTRGVTYTKLAAKFIQKKKNLYVVSLVDHEHDPCVEARDWDPEDDSRMPSWVPDWHSINRTTPMYYSVAAADAEDPEIRIDGDAKGAKGTPLPHLLVRGWVVDEISAVSRRMETTDFPVTQLNQERAKKNPFWLDRLWELVFPAEGDSTGRDALAVLETLSLAMPLGTREKDGPMGMAGLLQTRDEHDRSFAAYVLDYHELRRSASEASCVDDDGDCYLPARSLYDSLPVEVQAELRRRAEGATSASFIESITWPSMCRVMYRTRSGLVGMGSRVTRPGDLVCRVRGSSVLMTLRPIKESGAGPDAKTGSWATDGTPISCAHVGPTVVPARMTKGVVDGGEFGEKAAHFRIL